MHSFNLLAGVGRVEIPAATSAPSRRSKKLLMAAEYVAKEGNERVILCERGIKTFERSTRYTLDLSAVPVLKRETHLPVIVDPSHAAGRSDLVLPLARAAAAAGADEVMVEVTPAGGRALRQAAADPGRGLRPVRGRDADDHWRCWARPSAEPGARRARGRPRRARRRPRVSRSPTGPCSSARSPGNETRIVGFELVGHRIHDPGNARNRRRVSRRRCRHSMCAAEGLTGLDVPAREPSARTRAPR